MNLACWATTARQCSWIHALSCITTEVNTCLQQMLKMMIMYVHQSIEMETILWNWGLSLGFAPCLSYSIPWKGHTRSRPKTSCPQRTAIRRASSSHWQPTLQRKLVSAVQRDSPIEAETCGAAAIQAGTRNSSWGKRFGWFMLPSGDLT